MLQLLPPALLLLLLLLLILLLIAADAQQLRVYHVVQLPVAAARQSITAKQIRNTHVMMSKIERSTARANERVLGGRCGIRQIEAGAASRPCRWCVIRMLLCGGVAVLNPLSLLIGSMNANR